MQIHCRSALALLLLLVLAPAHASSEHLETVTGFDGIPLKGSWILPDSTPRAVALIVPGSGNVGMDGDVSSPLIGQPHLVADAKLSLQIAQRLAAVGVASFRYEKRGFGDATQLPNQLTTILARDAAAIAGQAQRHFPGVKFALVGFSEGAIVSSLVARNLPVDFLFLLGLPTRSIDDVFKYQFSEWPVELLTKRLHPNDQGEIGLSAFRAQGIEKPVFGEIFPSLNRKIEELDLDHNGSISVEHELKPAYTAVMAEVKALVQSPAFAAWYTDLRTVPAVRDFAAEIKVQHAFFYNGLEDAQVNPAWSVDDLGFFHGPVTARRYNGLGHCFASMEGSIGQIKTSGPLSNDLLLDLGNDFISILR